MVRKTERFYTNPGDPIHVLYAPSVAASGDFELKVCGKENTDEIIQSYAESTDIRVILARVAAGEVDLLQQRSGSFGDFTRMPTSLAEALQLQMDSNKLFNSLPVDVRRQFNDSPEQFFAAAGSEEWFKSLGMVKAADPKDAHTAPPLASERSSSADSVASS